MQEWSISRIREGIKDELKRLEGAGTEIFEFYFGTTDDHVLDIFGKSKAKEKVKPLGLWCIKVGWNGLFTIQRVDLLCGGNITVMEQISLDEKWMDEEEGRENFKEAVTKFQKEAKEYNHKLKNRDLLSYYRRAYVIFERNNPYTYTVKWIVVDHVYYEDKTWRYCSEKNIQNIKEAKCLFEDRNYDNSDICQMAYLDWNDYYMPEHLTMVYVKADIYYTLYDHSKEIYHIDRLYDNYKEFTNHLYRISQEIKDKNFRQKWQKVAGMDIDRMNQLSEILLMEYYLKNGLQKFDDSKVNLLGKQCGKYGEFLIERENLDEYIAVLTNLMTDCNEEKIRNAFLQLRHNQEKEVEEIYSEFINDYLQKKYEIGKIYLAKAEMDDFFEKKQVSVVSFLEKEDYSILKRQMLQKYNFDDMILGKIGENIPVKVIGFNENGTPVTEYAKDWYLIS